MTLNCIFSFLVEIFKYELYHTIYFKRSNLLTQNIFLIVSN